MTTWEMKALSFSGSPGLHHVSQTKRVAKSCNSELRLKRLPFASANGLIGTNVRSEYPAARIATVSSSPLGLGTSKLRSSAQLSGGPLTKSGFAPLPAHPPNAIASPIAASDARTLPFSNRGDGEHRCTWMSGVFLEPASELKAVQIFAHRDSTSFFPRSAASQRLGIAASP
jgi:hypothetical protein